MCRKRNIKRLGALLLTLALLVTLAPAALAAETASTMQLTRTEGTVSVSNASGRGVSVRDKMRLYNGYTVTTGAASYAWVALDDTKLVKIDANSEVEIHKNGKSLELLVKSGNLLFNVTEKLKEDETLNICTATMVAGVRGTAGWMGYNRGTSLVSILEGSVVVKSHQFDMTKHGITLVGAGQSVALAPGAEMSSAKITVPGIPGFVLAALLEDSSLSDRVQMASGLDMSKVTPVAVKLQLAEDQEKAAQANQIILENLGKMAGQIQAASGVSINATIPGGSSSDSSGGGGSSTPDVPVTPDEPVKPDEPKPEEPKPEEPEKPTVPADPDGSEEPDTGDFNVKHGTYGQDYSYSGGVLTILSEKALTISSKKETTDRIEVSKDAPSVDVTLDNVKINMQDKGGTAFLIPEGYTGNVTVHLSENSDNVLTGSDNFAGLQKDGSGQMTFKG